MFENQKKAVNQTSVLLTYLCLLMFFVRIISIVPIYNKATKVIQQDNSHPAKKSVVQLLAMLTTFCDILMNFYALITTAELLRDQNFFYKDACGNQLTQLGGLGDNSAWKSLVTTEVFLDGLHLMGLYFSRDIIRCPKAPTPNTSLRLVKSDSTVDLLALGDLEEARPIRPPV
jgi:hypothetical protein